MDLKLIFTLSILLPSLVCGQNWIIDHLLPEDYDLGQPPFESDSANESISVNYTIEVESFSMDEKESSLVTNMNLCLKWRDYRIQDYDNLTQVKLTQMDRFWKPKVYFRNGLESTVIESLNKVQFTVIMPLNKIVYFCSKLSITFQCDFHFSNFPFDEQSCRFELEDFERTAQRLDIQIESIEAPSGNDKLRITHTLTGICEENVDMENLKWFLQSESSLKPGCAYGGIRMVRRVNYYVIRYYLPTFLIVILSYTCFWMPTNAWPARATLGVSSIINVNTLSKSGYNTVPANDVVSLYWWFWGCQFLIYMTMIEFAFALAWVQFVNEKKLAHKENRESEDGHYFGKNNWYAKFGQGVEAVLRFVYGPLPFFERPQERNKVDYASRIIFSFALFLLVLIYIVATIPVWAEKYSGERK